MYFFAILSVILKITGQTVNGGCSPRNITLVRIYVYMYVYHFNGCPILLRFKCIYWLKSCQHESRAANLLTKSPNTRQWIFCWNGKYTRLYLWNQIENPEFLKQHDLHINWSTKTQWNRLKIWNIKRVLEKNNSNIIGEEEYQQNWKRK